MEIGRKVELSVTTPHLVPAVTPSVFCWEPTETTYNIETYLLLTPVLFRIGFGMHSVCAFNLFLHFFKQRLLPSFESTISCSFSLQNFGIQLV